MAHRVEKDGSTLEFDGPRAIRPEEYSSALALLNPALRPNGPHEIEKEYPLVLGKQNLSNMRVLVRNDKVIAHAAIYFSTLRSGDLAFKVGGINSVATHPSLQGRGLGSEVMRDCIRIMEDASAHLSILWTQRQDFYRRLGYEAAGSSSIFKLKAADLSRLPRACEVVPYSPSRLPDIIRIHRRESLRTERTAAEYEAYLGIPKTRVALTVRGGEVTAYAVMGKGEDLHNCIHDWGGDARDLPCLARELADSTETGDLMILAPARENEFMRLLREAGVPSAFEFLAMIRVVDVEGLSSVVEDYVGARIRMKFGLREDKAGVKILVGGEETIIEPARKLALLLFGPDKPSSLLGGLSQEALSALDNALPIPLFVWGLDSV